LLDEQKELLNYYITSFTDNAVELKMFLHEELSRLKTEINSISDSELNDRKEQITEKLQSFQSADINDNLLLTVLQTQQLVKELNDGSGH
jgi:hypothetical protein